jgi:D-glycero-alpha-D-manno-heptose-7-phosphate kinase
VGLDPIVERQLERRILLFYTGASRSAATILRDQQAASGGGDRRVVDSLHEIKAMAERAIEVLRSGRLDDYGRLLHESWQAKKRLSRGISNPRIDEWYELALENGALGGKIAGAGGGGFLMVYCLDAAQDTLTAALEDAGLVRMDFHFDHGGAVVLLDSIPRFRAIGNPDRVRETLRQLTADGVTA